ncbi:MAG TPA: TIGR03088 family PEP-CTERM/XrtA system glycosyltransferase [Casimicrobiaceae bacterium]
MSNGAQPPLVVHVIHRLAVGGLENGLVNLLNRMPLERYRHAIVCLADATDFAARIARTDVPIVELHKPPGTSLAIHARFHGIFRRMRPAIVHSRNLGALESQLAAAAARVPVRIHGEHGWDVHDPDGTSWRHAAIRRVYSPLVTRYIALSGHIADYLAARVGIAPGRIERICNGVDCERFAPDPSSRSRFPHEPFRDPALVLVGAVGRLEPIKDQVNLARAFGEAVARDPAMRRVLRLAIVGSGSLRTEIEAVLDAHGVRDLAWLAGERADVPALLPAFDVYALPSRAEGISNTLLEAMACGVPAVATAVGGNPELVAAGETGELVAPNDPGALAGAIVRLARDRDLRMRMSAASRRRAVDCFSLAQMVSRYTQVYDRELARGGSRAAHAQSRVRATTE